MTEATDGLLEPRWRACYAATPGIYLLSHSVGRMPASAQEALHQGFLAPWEAGQGEPWPQWMAALQAFPQALARLLNTRPEAICPQVNVSSGLTKVLGAQRLDANRNVIVFSERDFPSLGFVIEQAQKLGYRPRMLPAQHNLQDVQVWADALAEDVHTVLLTHAWSNTGQLAPVAEVAALARERGVFSVVDVAQSLGVIPIDLQQWGADVVLGSCVKWCCGGPGAGFLWLSPERFEALEPLDVGWFSHRDPFAFDIHHFDYAPDAARFMGGTPSVMPFVLAANSIALINRIGIQRVRRHNLALTQRLIDSLDAGELRSPAAPALRSGTVVLKPAGSGAVARLRQAGVAFDERAEGLRLSPHVYNTAEDVDAVTACLRA
ncbi:aminotransferase class V-fold PLP-dependent enzyme [Parahaliea mediterranea]|uniref:aminotransferase class V-fold PLP-dependent enzyme n=1 Tax=Parahaliea mediterranea TaxID=651086 RepID=UPI001F4DA720|nr:aminotransferase class V-fold PLP-dependent enzyme [Parahaliea mediterranea]